MRAHSARSPSPGTAPPSDTRFAFRPRPFLRLRRSRTWARQLRQSSPANEWVTKPSAAAVLKRTASDRSFLLWPGPGQMICPPLTSPPRARAQVVSDARPSRDLGARTVTLTGRFRRWRLRSHDRRLTAFFLLQATPRLPLLRKKCASLSLETEAHRQRTDASPNSCGGSRVTAHPALYPSITSASGNSLRSSSHPSEA